MRIRWLRKALKNLDAATNYVARDDPDAAQKLFWQIWNSIEALAAHPEIGRPERIFGTRELVIASYPFIMPYRIKNNEAQILRVFHTSQKLPDKW